jgi:hypothetical protein
MKIDTELEKQKLMADAIRFKQYKNVHTGEEPGLMQIPDDQPLTRLEDGRKLVPLGNIGQPEMTPEEDAADVKKRRQDALDRNYDASNEDNDDADRLYELIRAVETEEAKQLKKGAVKAEKQYKKDMMKQMVEQETKFREEEAALQEAKQPDWLK